MKTNIKERSPEVIKELFLSNGGEIVIWADGIIDLPSATLTLDVAIEMVGKLQSAVEFLRSYKE